MELGPLTVWPFESVRRSIYLVRFIGSRRMLNARYWSYLTLALSLLVTLSLYTYIHKVRKVPPYLSHGIYNRQGEAQGRYLGT